MFEELQGLQVLRDRSALHIELTTTPDGNVLTEATLEEFLSVLGNLHPAVRVVVVSGAGRDFCLGHDREELRRAPQSVPRIAEKARRVFEALSTGDVVSIARLHGRTIGAGLGLAASCDLRIADEHSTFLLPEAALGLPPTWGGALARLIHQIGPSHAARMILTGRPVDAESALRMGLLHVVTTADDLDTRVRKETGLIARRPAAALQMSKRMLQAYAASSRLADATLLDANLMAAAFQTSDSQPRPATDGAACPPRPGAAA